MQQCGPTLEHLDLTVIKIRNLAERLAREVIGVAIVKRDRANIVVDPCFFARPP
jgi:hypothetical protein